ncbi:MAG: D-alanine--D-alanine ligase [Deltaproteobacteria bacterium HGW-Deltaproteobacteria-19]|jgi:D-alanine-D-alanine ligase|nr:MAG: D-alanine--D-alanine ligase [Deltaproteobacteria bacterium HGW-Deltaproteobacteria-19]
MNVAVLHGAVADGSGMDEQDVLVEVETVCQALAALGHRPVPVPLSLSLGAAVESLRRLRPRFAFNLVESVAGKGNLISLGPLILDFLNIPFTGASADATYLTSNKLLAKRIMTLEGIDTPPWLSVEENPSGLFTPGRYILKSAWEHASIGIDEESVLHAEGDAALRKALRIRRDMPGGPFFAEIYVDGREFNISLLADGTGPRVLPPAEILFDGFPPGKLRLVDYRAKWETDSFEYRKTPRSFCFREEDAELLGSLKKNALQCWEVFRLRGYGRVDFRVDEKGRPWVLEVNTNPCLSPDAGFLAAAGEAGLDVTEVVARICADLP